MRAKRSLLQRLRECPPYEPYIPISEAADRIEELENILRNQAIKIASLEQSIELLKEELLATRRQACGYYTEGNE